MKTPSSFPILSLLPQRSLSYAKHNLPTEKYEKAFLEFFVAMWEQDLDLSKPELLLEVLARVYSEAEAKEIVDAASKPDIKKMLNDTTQKALDMGAFGCPWYLVRNARDVEEPFFGSDRFVLVSYPGSHVTVAAKHGEKSSWSTGSIICGSSLDCPGETSKF